MIVTVKQGKAEATIDVGNANGVSLTELLAEGLGYAQIELQSVIVSFENELTTRFDVGYQLNKNAGLLHATVIFGRQA